jgi:hypothetical protein
MVPKLTTSTATTRRLVANLAHQSWVRTLFAIALAGVVAHAQYQAKYGPPSPSVALQNPSIQCPVLPSLASTRVRTARGEDILIWFWNLSRKPVRGAQFRLVMLDAGGNRFPASQAYQASAELAPNTWTVAVYPDAQEKSYFGDRWKSLLGAEVQVNGVLFGDGTSWSAADGAQCSAFFLDADYKGKLLDDGLSKAEKLAVGEAGSGRETAQGALGLVGFVGSVIRTIIGEVRGH